MKKRNAYFLLLATAIIWGLGFVGTKETLNAGMTPNQVLASKFAIAFCILSLIFWKEFVKIKKETLKAGMVIGLPLYLGYITQTIGLLSTTAGTNAFITSTNVVMVPFIIWAVHKKRPDIFSFAGALLALIGVAFISITDLKSFAGLTTGDFYTLACALFFAFHIFTTGTFAKNHSPIQLTIVQMGFAAALSLVVLIFDRGFTVQNITNPKLAVMALLYSSIFSTAIAFLLQNIGQKYTDPSKAAILLSTESLFGAISGIILLNEPLKIQLAVGSVLILLAIITTETKLEFLFNKAEGKK